jgi:hypothetical protein
MGRFASKTLNRTFERIYLGTLEPSRGMINGAPATAGGSGTSSAADGTPPAPDAKVGQIARASGAAARSIGDVWTQKRHLAGDTVTIRGVVVKYNPGVMGKNWIHLQDGGGDVARGTNDAAALGDTGTITGTARTNRDVGAGYPFAVIVEEARVSKT